MERMVTTYGADSSGNVASVMAGSCETVFVIAYFGATQ